MNKTALQNYRQLHDMDGDPWTNLQAAVICQAFDDYVINCKLASGRRKCKDDYTKDPLQELRSIRDYLSRVDESGNGALLQALQAYLYKRRVSDMWRSNA